MACIRCKKLYKLGPDAVKVYKLLSHTCRNGSGCSDDPCGYVRPSSACMARRRLRDALEDLEAEGLTEFWWIGFLEIFQGNTYYDCILS